MKGKEALYVYLSKHFNIKNVLIVVLPIFLFFLLKENFYSFIKNNLLVNHNFSNIIFESFYLLVLIIISLLMIKKFRGTNRYIPSNFEFYLLFLLITGLGLILITPSSDWEFLKFKNISWLTSIYYVFPLFLILLFSFIGGIINFHTKRFTPDTKDNFLLEDNPRNTNEGNDFNNENLATKIFEVISKNNFTKSFSVGIIGPWGNGKSSLLNYIYSKILKDKNASKNIIQVRFSPYLIHTTDYAKAFLNVLSQELSPFNGSISELFNRYAKSISNLNKYLTIIDFTNKGDDSSTELYDKINKGIEKINKKIVVYLDDLDRLDDIEILQILKLIRNSANFKNTIFLVAMDKEYVLKRLLGNNRNLNTIFIDKFFQLEVYLPQINPLVLKNSFIKEVETSKKIEEKSKELIIDSFRKNEILFDYYIKNFRDLKKLMNQIVFETQFIPREIATKDLINFILLKTKFPSIIPLIIDNEDFFFDIESNTYTLKEKSISEQKNNPLFVDLNSYKIRLDEYELFDDLYSIDSIIKEHLTHLEAKDLKLILITLITLFSKKNTIDSFSIRYKANFRKLMEQNLLEEDVSLDSFNELLSSANWKTILYKEYKIQKKLNNLLIRLEHYKPKDNVDSKRILRILAVLLNIHRNSGFYDQKLMKMIMSFSNKDNFNLKNKAFFVEDFFSSSSDLSNENKLAVLGEIWNEKDNNGLWGIKSKNFEKLSLESFEMYLEEHSGNKLWKAGDLSFFKIYHSIKYIEPIIDKVVELTLNFWKKNDLEILLSQMISNTTYDSNIYEISSVTEKIFGGKLEFSEFILQHRNIQTPDGIEISEFLNLCQIVEFKKNVCFNFIHNNAILESENKRNGNNSYRELRIKQVFFKIKSKSLADVIRSNYIGGLPISFHWFKDNHYLVVEFPKVNFNTELRKFSEVVFDIAKDKLGWRNSIYDVENVLKKEIFLTNEDPKATMEVYSIQP